MLESSACSRESFLNCSMSFVAFSAARRWLSSSRRATKLSSFLRRVAFTCGERRISLAAEDPRERVGEQASLVAGALAERLRRPVHQLVGEPFGQRLEDRG